MIIIIVITVIDAFVVRIQTSAAVILIAALVLILVAAEADPLVLLARWSPGNGRNLRFLVTTKVGILQRASTGDTADILERWLVAATTEPGERILSHGRRLIGRPGRLALDRRLVDRKIDIGLEVRTGLAFAAEAAEIDVLAERIVPAALFLCAHDHWFPFGRKRMPTGVPEATFTVVGRLP